MNFSYDSASNFYYYGEVEPSASLYKDYILNRSHKAIAIDTETISLKEKTVLGIGIAIEPKICFYFPLFPTPSPVTPWFLINNPEVEKVYQNALFDLVAMREYDVDMHNIKDTAIMARLLGYPSAILSDLAPTVGMETEAARDTLVRYKAKTMLDVPKDKVALKCCQDAGATLALYQDMLPKCDQAYLDVELATIPIMIKMSYQGLKIDQGVRAELEIKYTKELDYYRSICEGIGFSPGSPQQVAYMLAKRGAYSVFNRLPHTRNRYGQTNYKNLSTDVDTLRKMTDPLARIVLDYRAKAKLLGTYIIPFAHESRAYTRFHLDATTGRPSSTDRNMQNIPGAKQEMLDGTNPRHMFIPDSGCWTDMDFSQTELRTLAYLSGDREMQYIYLLPEKLPDGTTNPEADIHQATANFLEIPRKIAKNVNFAMIYGGTDETISNTAEIPNIVRCHQLKSLWFLKFREAGDWIQTIQQDATRNPFATTVFGRNLRLPDIEEEGLEAVQRKAVNYRIQGSAAEVLKRALIICQNLTMSLQVHDEILFDGYIQLPKEQLEHIAPFRTPIDVRYLERWE